MAGNMKFRIITFLLAVSISLAVLLGGYAGYKKMIVEKPAIKELTAITGHEVKVATVNKRYEIKIAPGKVSDIQKIYTQSAALIEKQISPDEYQLEIQDHRNARLTSLYRDLQPAIYEALAGNRFVWLQQEIEQQAGKQKLDGRVFVDEKYLYIQLEDTNHYLYQVIPRTSELKADSQV